MQLVQHIHILLYKTMGGVCVIIIIQAHQMYIQKFQMVLVEEVVVEVVHGQIPYIETQEEHLRPQNLLAVTKISTLHFFFVKIVNLFPMLSRGVISIVFFFFLRRLRFRAPRL